MIRSTRTVNVSNIPIDTYPCNNKESYIFIRVVKASYTDFNEEFEYINLDTDMERMDLGLVHNKLKHMTNFTDIMGFGCITDDQYEKWKRSFNVVERIELLNRRYGKHFIEFNGEPVWDDRMHFKNELRNDVIDAETKLFKTEFMNSIDERIMEHVNSNIFPIDGDYWCDELLESFLELNIQYSLLYKDFIKPFVSQKRPETINEYATRMAEENFELVRKALDDVQNYFMNRLAN